MNLAVEIAGLRFKNPLIAASGSEIKPSLRDSCLQKSNAASQLTPVTGWSSWPSG